MKKLSFFLSLIFLCFTGTQASQQYDDLIKLVKSGAAEEVIVAYINTCSYAYNLSSDKIVQLKELGASPKIVITAIQHKGSVLANSNNQAVETDTAAFTAPRHHPAYRTVPVLRSRKTMYWLDPAFAKINQALQIDVPGLLFGTLTLNYEYLLKHQHGFVVEGSYYEGGDSHGENAELSYRWHWAKSMNSGFLGIFAKGGRYHGSEHDVWRNVIDKYSLKSITVGPNIGARWVLPYGLSVVAGVGYGHTWLNFDNSVPRQSTIDKLRWDASFNSELSLGCAF